MDVVRAEWAGAHDCGGRKPRRRDYGEYRPPVGGKELGHGSARALTDRSPDPYGGATAVEKTAGDQGPAGNASKLLPAGSAFVKRAVCVCPPARTLSEIVRDVSRSKLPHNV